MPKSEQRNRRSWLEDRLEDEDSDAPEHEPRRATRATGAEHFLMTPGAERANAEAKSRGVMSALFSQNARSRAARRGGVERGLDSDEESDEETAGDSIFKGMSKSARSVMRYEQLRQRVDGPKRLNRLLERAAEEADLGPSATHSSNLWTYFRQNTDVAREKHLLWMTNILILAT